MSALVRCPDCEATLRVRTDQIGQRGRCGRCGLVFFLATPVGKRLLDDEPESPQVIEEPTPQPEPSNPVFELNEDESEVERPRRRKTKATPKPVGSSRGVLLALAIVFGGASAVGGFFLMRHLTADKGKKAEPEVVATTPQNPAPQPAPNPGPTKINPAPADPLRPQALSPQDIPKPAAPARLKFDGPVSALYTASEGRYVLFQLSTLQQLVVYDTVAGKVTATIPDGKQSVIAGGRNSVFIGQRTSGQVVRYDLRTGVQQGVVTLPETEQLRYMAVGSASNGPLLLVTYSPTSRTQARLYDPETLTPINAPIEDTSRPTVKSFPLSLSLTPSHVGVSADGRAITLSDRLYLRTTTGYRAVKINASSGLLPTGDGKLAVGNSLWGDDGHVIRFPDRSPTWSIPAATGSFFIAADYPKLRELRLTLYADRELTPLGELSAAPISQWFANAPSVSLVSLHRHFAFLPEPGLVVFCPSGAQEAQFIPVDLPAMAARANRDILFTTVAPAEVAKGQPYTYTASAVSRDGVRPTFALKAGPTGMAITPEGSLVWNPDATFPGPSADVEVIARTGNGKETVQQFRVFLPLKAGDVVAVNQPPKNPADPPRPKPPVNPPPKNPFNPRPPKGPIQPPAIPAVAAREVKLPGAASAIAVGGSGRYICLHLPANRQIAVFDATEGKVVKYLPVGGNKILLAAGAEKIFVVLPDDNVVQRWDLKTFQKEVTAPLTVKGKIKSALMGSAATGPLWLTGDDISAIDTKTLRALELKADQNLRVSGIGEGMRVSADGRTLGTWSFNTSPSGQTVITLNDTALKTSYQHDSVGHITPGPDGRVIHTAVGRFTPQGKTIGERDGVNGFAPLGKAYSFPAAQGTSLYLNVTFDRGLAAGQNRAQLAVHWASDGRKLADLPGVATGEFNHWDREAIGNDQRYMLLPEAKSLVVFPETNDRLLLYPFDLDAILDKSGKDYLLVDAPPATQAVRGEKFTQTLTIKSKKGGVKVKVDSGPEGLTVSNTGQVTWAVPKDLADNEVSVIITVSDASGQEMLQTLRLEVGGEKGAAVVVADPPVAPKKDDPGNPPKNPPAAAKKEVVTVKLPGTVKAVTVGAGGKLLILHLPQQKQLAIFDVAQGKVVKYLPTAEAMIFMAAGQEHLFVANPTAGVIQRYNLKTFEKEATVQQPIEGTIAGLCIGSASKGPLLICPKGDQWGAKPVLVDPIKMKMIPGGDQTTSAAAPFIRASADGRVFGWRNSTGSEGHDMTLMPIVDGKPKPRTFGAGTSLLLPSPDGRFVYCGEGVFNSQFKKLYPTEGNNSFNKPFLPAVSGNLFMQLEADPGGRFPGDPMAVATPGRVNFFLPGQYRPFAFIDKVEGLAGESYGYGGISDPIMHDARVHLCPDAERLVVIPTTNDKLILHPFNLEDLLAKSDTDYLLVTSEPPPDVGRGALFHYTPVVRSRKGEAKVKLESGPEGMKMVGGKLMWSVPADFNDNEVDVILTISDATGQEIFQSFKLAIRDRKPGEAAAPAELPKPDPKDDKPVGKEDPPKGAKPADLALKPAALTKDEQSVNLPSAAGEIIPAAGGRLLLIHLPKERKIAVFDTALVKIVKYLPVAEDEAKFAAGREKLVILLPGANVVQRWNLATLERELSIANPIGSPVKALAMGSNSSGPLIVTTKSAPNKFDSPTILLFDPKTFKKSEYTFGGGAGMAFHPQYPPEVRVSANGELITAWVWGLSPSGIYIWSREGNTYKGSYQHDSAGALLPDPDGRTVYASGRVLTANGKKLNDAPKGFVIPAVQGSLILALDGGVDRFGRGERKPLRVSVHIDRDSRPLITLPELTGLTSGGRRLFLIPDARLLVVTSESNDKLILHRFDLDALLAKSDVDYLFVASRAPATAIRGETFRYPVQVKSRKGGVKFNLDAAPKGLTLDAKGVITWEVPKDFDGNSASVILTISDMSGQETIHSFVVSVSDAKP